MSGSLAVRERKFLGKGRVRELVILGFTQAEINKRIAAEFEVTEQTSINWLSEVLQEISETHARLIENRPLNLSLAIERMLYIYREAVQDKDYRAALAAQQMIIKLQGLDTQVVPQAKNRGVVPIAIQINNSQSALPGSSQTTERTIPNMTDDELMKLAQGAPLKSLPLHPTLPDVISPEYADRILEGELVQ